MWLFSWFLSLYSFCSFSLQWLKLKCVLSVLIISCAKMRVACSSMLLESKSKYR